MTDQRREINAGPERRTPDAPGRVSSRRRIQVGSLRITGRRRRPSGQKPALPTDLRATGMFWIFVGLAVVAVWIALFALPGAAAFWTTNDHKVVAALQDARAAWATALFKAINFLASDAMVRILRVGTIVALVFFRRWRHLVAGIAVIALVEATAAIIAESVARPRPLVEILVQWEGYSHPSNPVASLAVTLGVMGYSLVPRGRLRLWWFTGSGAIMTLVVLSRVYLGVDHPSDAMVGLLLAISAVVVVYKVFVPETVWPVTYSRGNTAHLDVTGQRGIAVRNAARDQLGVEVLDLHRIGLEGSAGSTPLLLTCATTGSLPDELTFGKIYAQNHLRADRWYKWGRTLAYGSLEDEVRFGSVRRLVEYEDYLMRVMRDAGVPSAEPFGFVEITPEREYLIVTEYLAGAEEIGNQELNTKIIDNALEAVRAMWEAGLAHRDIKPANVMVRDDDVYLIDVAFGQVRPTPWRQAVDLANMMLVLGLSADPQLVYDRSLELFSAQDVAEGFAATHSVTIPSQTRHMIKQHQKETGEDLIATFRGLAPEREPVSIQRWSAKRIGVALVTVAAVLATTGLIISNAVGKGFL